MKLFFDESGYTGCIMPNRKGQLYNDGQRHFVLGGVFVNSDTDETQLLEKYHTFKQNFGFGGEIKGSSLMTQENNEALDYFINQILDDNHFFICNYDKIFYLATLISIYIFGWEFRKYHTLEFYQYASALSGENEDLFLEYCSTVYCNTEDAKVGFLHYLINYPFEKLERNNSNPYIYFAKSKLINKSYDELPLVRDSYSCRNTVHLINMTALGEILLSLKYIHHINIEDMSIYHDDLKGYEEEYRQSFSECNIEIEFIDSRENELIQLADNACSIYRKCFEKSFEAFQKGTQWTSNVWFSENYSRIIRKVGMQNIKMVTPIADWALPYAAADTFGTDHNTFMKYKDHFPEIFYRHKYRILREISSINMDLLL